MTSRASFLIVAVMGALMAGPALAQKDGGVEIEVGYTTDGDSFPTSVKIAPGQRVMFQIRARQMEFMRATIENRMDGRILRPARTLSIAPLFGADCGSAGAVEDPLCGGAAGDEGTEFVRSICGDCTVADGESCIVYEAIAVGPGVHVDDPSFYEPEDCIPSECEGTCDEKDSFLVAPQALEVVLPGLVCTKEVSLDGVNYSSSIEAELGDDVFFRVRIENDGEVDLFDLDLEDSLPAGFSSIMATGCDVIGRRVECSDVGEIEVGGSSIAVTYRATVVAESGVLESDAVVGAVPGDLKNPGTPVTCTSSARVQIRPADGGDEVAEIPTLEAWGVLLLVLALGGTLLRYRAG